MKKADVLAALLAMPSKDRVELCRQGLAGKRDGYVVAHISPQGVVRESTLTYSNADLAASYKVGERCPFCDAKGKDSLFVSLDPHPEREGIRRATFGQCKHRVNVSVGA